MSAQLTTSSQKAGGEAPSAPKAKKEDQKSVKQLINQLFSKTNEAIKKSHEPGNLIDFDATLDELTEELKNKNRSQKERDEIFVRMREFQKLLRKTEKVFLGPLQKISDADDGASTSTAPCICCATGSH